MALRVKEQQEKSPEATLMQQRDFVRKATINAKTALCKMKKPEQMPRRSDGSEFIRKAQAPWLAPTSAGGPTGEVVL
jgi:hypothetical protein